MLPNLAALDVTSERRRGPRFAMLMRTAKLIASAGEYLCIVRDASPHGVSVRTFGRLPGDSVVNLELAKGDGYAMRKVWERDGSAGFQFVELVQLDALLSEGLDNLPKRPVRLKLAVQATLDLQGTTHEVLLRDISQQGASIECFTRLEIGENVRLESPHLPAMLAKVRWRREPYYGLIFEQTFQFDDLARLTAPIKRKA